MTPCAWDARHLLELGPLGVALASCARGDRLPKNEQKYLCMEALVGSDVDDAQAQLLITAIETYLELNEEQEMKYAERVAQSTHKTEMQSMELTWAGRLHESGVELGRREGRREGVQAGRRMLRLILSQRFGDAAQPLVDRVERVDDLARIEAISREVLGGASLAEIERRFGPAAS